MDGVGRLGPPAFRTLLALARASAFSRTVRIRFRDTEREEGKEAAEVLALSFDPPRWRVAAWLRERGSLRLLDLSRVLGVRATRRRAGPPPDGFDPGYFAARPLLDPDAGPAREATVRLPPAVGRLAPALLPAARLGRAGGGWIARVRTSRPEVLAALAESLGAPAGIDSRSRMPARRAAPPNAETRLLRLATWLLDRTEPATRAQIYEAFGDDYRGRPEAKERKFSRDKDELRRLGFAVEKVDLGRAEDQVGYLLDARSSSLPPLDLAPEEAALLWTAGVGALRLSDHPLRDDLESALRKLAVGATGLPPRAAALEDLAGEPGGAGDQKLLSRLVEAWERRKRITIGYWRAASDEVVDRRVDVFGWAARRGEWIFVGHDHRRGEVRIFYLSRVRSLRANPARPQDPDYQIPEGFDVRRWSRQEIWDYAVHPPRPAGVRFRGSLARIASSLLPAAKVTTAPDGARLARLEVQNLRGLVRQALAWGPEAELVEPPEGRAMAREILAALRDGGGTVR
jgi:proteasome accessory factor B